MEQRILQMLEKATEEQIYRATQGSNSYREINRHALYLAGKHGVSVEQAVAIIAVLSPIITWEENLVDAAKVISGEVSIEPGGSKETRVLTGPACSALNVNVIKAVEIRQGFSILRTMRGRKVRAFYYSILHPDNTFSVCVDRHVGRVAMGWDLAWREVDALLKKPGVYEKVADAYRYASEPLPHTPLELQAIAWLVCREGLFQTRLEFGNGV
jgi:hypothetical protein